MSASSQFLHERAHTLLTLIEGLQIENDLESARRTLDDWKSEMLVLINNIHLTTTTKLDSLTDRLKQFKQRHTETLRHDIIHNLSKIYGEKRKNLSEQELNDIQKKVNKIDCDLQAFGKLLEKITRDQKKLVEQIDILKQIQRDNLELSRFDQFSSVKRCFTLDSCHSPFLAVSDDNHMLIEEDNHLVLFNEQRRLNEIPWQREQNRTYTGSIKDLIYSNYLEQFCILSALNFFTFDIHACLLEKSEQIKATTGCHFQSIACLPNASDVFFALTTSGSRTNIERWSLLSGSLIKRWYHDIFESDDRHISCIRANETCLAVCIKPQKAESYAQQNPAYWRIDLFDFSLVRMYRGVNLKIGGLGMFLTPFDDRSWLAINGNDIWLIGEHGETIEEKRIDADVQIHNVLVRKEDSQGQRDFIIKLGKPAELRII